MKTDLPRRGLVWPPRCLLIVAGALALAACGESQPAALHEPVEVSVVQLRPEAITIYDVLPGRVAAYRVAEIRPQVGGIVRNRLFRQGSEVEAGQPLFQIDPAAFAAEVDMAAAALSRSDAALNRTEAQVRRVEALLKTNTATQQAYDEAIAARAQAAADVAYGRAALERRTLDLGFATIRAPIAGRIDHALASEGLLATPGGTSPLAIVQQIDRVYVDLRQPARRLDALRGLARPDEADAGTPVEILSADGKAYPVVGRLLFSGISVDPGTGEIVLRVEADNPQRLLLPGMFVRARLGREKRPAALLVPLQAVQRDGNGVEHVSIVEDAGRVVRREIVTGGQIDGRVVVESGLRAGDQVVVEGQDRIQPGAQVNALPWRVERVADAEPHR
ncbi:efflux RND transporter periplasmic adaptor subunit [Xanthobacter sp. DSM 24535]|uniref:efflux RND transporter periplasmic adaptor subunit n=1 Tax=Roseixanthobacter psychrophilus TaxID=3119917 RepID=UPI003727B4A3